MRRRGPPKENSNRTSFPCFRGTTLTTVPVSRSRGSIAFRSRCRDLEPLMLTASKYLCLCGSCFANVRWLGQCGSATASLCCSAMTAPPRKQKQSFGTLCFENGLVKKFRRDLRQLSPEPIRGQCAGKTRRRQSLRPLGLGQRCC